MHTLVTMLTRFVGVAGRATKTGGGLSQAFGAAVRTARSLTGAVGMAAGVIGGAFMNVMSQLTGVFADNIKKAIGIELSLKGMMEAAEEARKYFSTLADELNFYSSSTGSTANAMGLLMDATGKSKAGLQSLKGTMEAMVNAGADTDATIKGLLPTLGDLEVKTGISGSTFALMTVKFQQMFNEKTGIVKDVKNLAEALVGTGLKGANLEQTMQGLTEAAEKLAFATRGDTLDIKKLGLEYGKTVATFKAFGVSAQTTTTFLNGLLDPENVEKNMLLMNKLGVSYGDFNDMLNSGKGQEQFFKRVLNNIGDVAKEANMIQDASTRFKYLKDTLGLPPEIANKLMKVAPQRMQSELRRIKKEMDDAEKKKKYRDELKAREEKYEEQMTFLRMQMVAPLVGLIERNRTSIAAFGKAMVPVMQGLSKMVARFLTPFTAWMDGFTIKLEKITKLGDEDFSGAIKEAITDMIDALAISFKMIYYSPEFQQGLEILKQVLADAFEGMMNAIAAKYPKMASFLGIGTTGKDVVDRKTEGRTKGRKDLRESAATLTSDQKDKMISGAQESFKKTLTQKGLQTNKDIDALSDKVMGELTTGHFRATNVGELRDALIKEGNSEKIVDKMVQDLVNTYTDQDEKFLLKKQQEAAEAFDNRANAALDNINYIEKKYEGMSENNPLYKNYKSAIADAKKSFKDITKMSYEDYKNEGKILKNEEKPEDNTKPPGSNIDTTKLNLPSPQNPVVPTIDTKELDATKAELLKTQKDLDVAKAELAKKDEGATFANLFDNLFGEKQDSFKTILIDIHEVLSDTYDANRKNTRNAVIASGKGSAMTTLNNLLKPSSAGQLSSFIGGSNLVNATADTAKNIQEKQVIYLKSIAESTYDSAAILKYIGTNLLFTPTGLGVNIAHGQKTALYDLSGKEAKDASGSPVTKISNFKV